MTTNRQTQSHSWGELIDCCGLFSSIKRYFTARSFAEQKSIVKDLCTGYDESILHLYRQTDFSGSRVVNPPLWLATSMFEIFQSSQDLSGCTMMLIRNSYFLSRLFVKNAVDQGVQNRFNSTRVRILDVGCGNALSLPGVIAYFGRNKVDYSGIDLDNEKISQATNTYAKFPQVKFSCVDANKFLADEANAQQFEVILFQHPNLLDRTSIAVFEKMFLQAEKVLAPGGVIYCTFYCEQELNYFINNILPNLPDFFKASSTSTPKQFNIQLELREGSEVIEYTPEKFCLTSAPKPGLQNSYSSNSKKNN